MRRARRCSTSSPGPSSSPATSASPLVPVLVSGTRALVVGDGPWMAPRVDIRVRVLDPVEFPAGADAVRVAAEMRERFARELGRPL